jgi:hypothetical protein
MRLLALLTGGQDFSILANTIAHFLILKAWQNSKGNVSDLA